MCFYHQTPYTHAPPLPPQQFFVLDQIQFFLCYFSALSRSILKIYLLPFHFFRGPKMGTVLPYESKVWGSR
jgi:hypothetical protein